ncbi:MAG: guanylate cyclase [Clostridium sp. SCN 57-10]|nr:MAG: guanylate cyclase [Clostridium sp. SCN 57-10]
MFTLSSDYPSDKTEFYALLCAQLRALTDGEPNAVANLANASALLGGALRDINWAGFYLMRDGMLVLGPFQGKPACIRIPLGRGVCGTAAAQNETQLIANVHDFPGHIACDAASNSEIVVPLRTGGAVVGVLDIDSPEFSRFDGRDRAGLEAFCALLESACDWEEK